MVQIDWNGTMHGFRSMFPLDESHFVKRKDSVVVRCKNPIKYLLWNATWMTIYGYQVSYLWEKRGSEIVVTDNMRILLFSV